MEMELGEEAKEGGGGRERERERDVTAIISIFCSYLRCFYWAIQTIATTHNLDRGGPITNLEYKIDLLGYLFSVFVLAIIFGEVSSLFVCLTL